MGVRRNIFLATFLFLGRIAAAQDAAPHHEANFDAERKQANEMYLRGDRLQAGPLYADLSRQDPTIAVFAERHGSGLVAAADIETDPVKRKALHEQAMAELRRALKLGDDSDLVKNALAMDEDNKRSIKAGANNAAAAVPPTPGYRTSSDNPQATQAFRDAEVAFAKNDTATAIAGFKKAAELDPQFYMAKLYAGDSCFRAQDYACAEDWFAKAIATDANRETAYRYWADALMKQGHPAEAKVKYEQAIVAEPYVRLSWNGLAQWGGATKTQMGSPGIMRPAITSSGDGAKVVMPQGPAADVQAWTIYAGCRTDADHTRPAGSRRTAAEEVRCLQLAVDTANRNVQSGKVQASELSPGFRALISLQRDGMMECWVLLNGADQEVLKDYPAYREAHRDLLIAYIDKYVVHQDAGPATQRPQLQIANPN